MSEDWTIDRIEALLAEAKPPRDLDTVENALLADVAEWNLESPFHGRTKLLAQYYIATEEIIRFLLDENKRMERIINGLGYHRIETARDHKEK